jgi:hypothetical protein
MKTRTFLLVSAMAGALAIGAVDAASAQGMQDRMGTGMMQGGPSQGAGGGIDAGRDGFVSHRVGHESVQHDAWRHGCAIRVARNAGHESIARRRARLSRLATSTPE